MVWMSDPGHIVSPLADCWWKKKAPEGYELVQERKSPIAKTTSGDAPIRLLSLAKIQTLSTGPQGQLALLPVSVHDYLQVCLLEHVCVAPVGPRRLICYRLPENKLFKKQWVDLVQELIPLAP
jgi:hypothetical protein